MTTTPQSCPAPQLVRTPTPQPQTPTLGAVVERTLSRITSGGRFIPALDGLRFVAITSVVFYHLAGYLAAKSPAAKADPLFTVLDKGNCGVQLFFIISGFILAFPFVEQFLAGGKSVDLQKYYRRRLTRLVPPYFCNLVIAYAIQVAAGHGTPATLFPDFLASSFYVHNLTLGGMSLINGVAWSLEIEVQFYVLAPLLALVFLVPGRNVRRGLLLGMIAAVTAGKSIAETAGVMSGVWRGTIVWYLDCFLAGLLLADIFVVDWKRSPARTAGWDLVGLAAWGAVLFTQFHDVGRHWLVFPAVVAYVAAFRGRLLNWLLSNVWFVTIGGMCYTIYLYHFFLISAVGHWTRPMTEGSGFPLAFAVQAALICPVVVVVCAGLFVVFEKPFMRLGVSRRPAAALVVESR